MDWENLDLVWKFGGILSLWNSCTLTAIEVIKDVFSFSISSSLKDGEGVHGLMGVYVPARTRGKVECMNELGGLCGANWWAILISLVLEV